jgi:hypothetical protein
MAIVKIKVPDWLDRICVWPVTEYRRWKYGYTYRRIYLGEGVWTIVDLQDYYHLNNFNWCPKKRGLSIYAVRLSSNSSGSIRIISMHKGILKAPVGLLVDHKNGETLDNRRSNLRIATHSQNMFNRKKVRTKTSSRFIGVSYDKKKRLWKSSISTHGRKIFLGYFKNEIDAAKACDAAAKKYHGEFARLNFPD